MKNLKIVSIEYPLTKSDAIIHFNDGTILDISHDFTIVGRTRGHTFIGPHKTRISLIANRYDANGVWTPEGSFEVSGYNKEKLIKRMTKMFKEIYGLSVAYDSVTLSLKIKE